MHAAEDQSVESEPNIVTLTRDAIKLLVELNDYGTVLDYMSEAFVCNLGPRFRDKYLVPNDNARPFLSESRNP